MLFTSGIMRKIFFILFILIACENLDDENTLPIQLDNKISIQIFSQSGFSQEKFSVLLDSIKYEIMKIENNSVIFADSGSTDSSIIAFNTDVYEEGIFKLQVKFYDLNGIENFKTAIADTQFIKEIARPFVWRLFAQTRLVKFTLSAEQTDSISIDFKHLTATLTDITNDTIVYDSLKLINKKLTINNVLAGTYNLKVKTLIKNDSVSSSDSLFINQLFIGKNETETITEIDVLFN